jgi:hypothetical protein
MLHFPFSHPPLFTRYSESVVISAIQHKEKYFSSIKRDRKVGTINRTSLKFGDTVHLGAAVERIENKWRAAILLLLVADFPDHLPIAGRA